MDPTLVAPDLSVLICTRDRASSLARTLDCLLQADPDGLKLEIVVIDNGSRDDTKQVAAAYAARVRLRLLMEPRPGKSHCLNRALDAGGVGEIIAVLDDDMSPHPDWLKGVRAICARWPHADVFTGRSYVIWPESHVPEWCRSWRLSSWAYSVMDYGPGDEQLAPGQWFSGNHFWFRTRVLTNGRRFSTDQPDLDMSQAEFILRLVEDGHVGVIAPDAVCGHRIQPELLRLSTIRQRARSVGRGCARVRLQPSHAGVKQARLFREHPVLARLVCLGGWTAWSACRVWGRLRGSSTRGIELELRSIERASAYREYLRIAGRRAEYRLRWRPRARVSHPAVR